MRSRGWVAIASPALFVFFAAAGCDRTAVKRSGGSVEMNGEQDPGGGQAGGGGERTGGSDGTRRRERARGDDRDPGGLPAGSAGKIEVYSLQSGARVEVDRVVRSDEEWRRDLDPMEYEVMRRKGTERAFTGKYWNHHGSGKYTCAACGNDLFLSETKYDSGCGWPSFYAPVDTANVEFTPDHSHGMVRTEVTCARCGAHLGHIFDDGPAPTGQRYCMNSVSLDFTPDGAEPAAKDPPGPTPTPPGK